jgi:hypothetical protein
VVNAIKIYSVAMGIEKRLMSLKGIYFIRVLLAYGT